MSIAARVMKIGLPDDLGGGVASFVTGDPTVHQAVGCLDPWGDVNGDFPDVNQDGQVTQADCDAFVNLLRGNNAHNWGYRLGDIFHSQPVVVGDPSATYVDRSIHPTTGVLLTQADAPSTYAAFRNTVRADNARVRLALVGTNAGFLHAFNAGNWDTNANSFTFGTGAEVWAYTPPNFHNAATGRSSLANLGFVNNPHGYYVDGSVRAADVWLDHNNDGVKAADGSEWHTVALVNLRQGGTGVFHLDITDRKNPRPIGTALGDASYPAFFPTCGYSWSEATIGKVKLLIAGKKVDRWVAFFGDGESLPDRTADPACGKKFYAVDLRTGKTLWEVSGSTDPNMVYDIASSPVLLDLNGDGFVDRVYVGDTGGQMWRFDVSAMGTSLGGNVDPLNNQPVDNWVVSRLYVASDNSQSFFDKPAVTFDSNMNVWLFASSGNRVNPLLLDPDDDEPPIPAGKGKAGRLFGIKDTYPTRVAPWTSADLQDVTGTNTLDPAAITKPGGWLIKLDKGEKSYAAIEVFNRTVFFSTIVPTPLAQDCTLAPVQARLYMVFYTTGGGVTDVAGYKASNTPSNRYVQLGSGAPTRPLITTLALGGGGVLITGTTNRVVRMGTPTGVDLQFDAPRGLRVTRFWRQN